MYKTVFFDLDGTVLDTVPDIRAVLNGTLAAFNLPPVSERQTKEFVGNGAYELVRRAAGENCENLQEIYARYVADFAACENGLSTLYDGEEEVLSALKERGVRLGIVTNKPQKATLNVYEKFFKRFGFFYVQGQEEGVPLKPSPQGVLNAVEKFALDKRECLFVGDGETDVLTAANAGLDCVSVLWGYRTREQLLKAGATRFAENFKKLQREILG